MYVYLWGWREGGGAISTNLFSKQLTLRLPYIKSVLSLNYFSQMLKPLFCMHRAEFAKIEREKVGCIKRQAGDWGTRGRGRGGGVGWGGGSGTDREKEGQRQTDNYKHSK